MLNILFRSDKCHIAEVYGLWMDFTTLTTQSTLKKKEKILEIGWKVSRILMCLEIFSPFATLFIKISSQNFFCKFHKQLH